MLSDIQNASFIKSHLSRLSNFPDVETGGKDREREEIEEGLLFSNAYDIDINEIRIKYDKTLTAYYNKLCRQTLASMVDHFSIDNILTIVMKDNTQMNNFVKFLQLRGNEAMNIKHELKDDSHTQNFLKMVKKLIQYVSEHQEHQKLIVEILDKSIIQGSTKTLQKVMQDSSKSEVMRLFKDENNAIEARNVHLVPELLRYIAPKLSQLFFNPETFSRLLSVLLLQAVVFGKDDEFKLKIYTCIYRLIAMLLNDNQKFDVTEPAKCLLNNQFLKTLFCKFEWV